ncbi:MAG: HAD family hydrolase [Planctomycetota bacterium]|jgi:phosphoglycolate phosphatase|nr:HAD family hydrolase [Planctomycetota bacterium]
MRQRRGVLFDHDGTLVDSLDLVEVATNAVLADRGHPPQDRTAIIDGMVLPTGPRLGLLLGIENSGEQAALAEAFFLHARAIGVAQARLYPGIAELLAELHEAGWALGVVSNNEGRLVRELLADLGLAGYLAVTLGEEDMRAAKPDPSGIHQALAGLDLVAEQCHFIGDSSSDSGAAAAAGVPAIGVAWGTHNAAELRAMGFPTVVETIADLRTALVPAG